MSSEQMAEIKNVLIDLVKEHPLIYDKSHPLHYRTNARNEVWDEISKILGIPGKLHNSLSSYWFIGIVERAVQWKGCLIKNVFVLSSG